MREVKQRRVWTPDTRGMQGLITTRHLLTNAPTIIHEFGLGAYLRCVAAVVTSRHEVTFLECVIRMRRH